MSGGLGGGEGLGWGAGSRGTTILFAGGSTRPLPVTRRLGLTCAKPSFAIYGKLPINTKREDLIYPRDVLHHRGTWNSGERHAQADNECR